MTDLNMNVKALHFKGGNYFDDMQIDIDESHRRLSRLVRNPRSVRKTKFKNCIRLFLTKVAMRLRIYELLVVNGICKRWFDDFKDYWSAILNGRPFWNTIEFFILLHDYRKKQQYTSQLEWGGAAQHLKNWQKPNGIYSTLQNVRVLATNPSVCSSLWKHISKSARILEFGCSLAPYYYCYREFFSHLDCKWILADIPNFPFHYARYLYRNDAEVEFVIINENDFLNPLRELDGFDVVILTTVLEHLDDPLFISKYLLKKLKPGGFLVFDYIKSDATGLDHPNALAMRRDCLRNIMTQVEIISGNIDNVDESLGLCIGRKKIAPQ